MEAELKDYFKQRGIEIDTTLSLVENIKRVVEEKEGAINNLSEQITRGKCEQIKNDKLIKSLQEKVSQLAPNISNTGSNFMMSSEFKTNFEEFLTTMLPNTLGQIFDRPQLFSKCTADIFTHTYMTIAKQLEDIISNVCKALGIDSMKKQQHDLEYKVKLSLLKILQEFWDVILPFNPQKSFQYYNSTNSVPSELIEEMNELLTGDDFIEMEKQLHKLCVYMLLQEKNWEFVDLNNGETVKFSKKEHCCIDGWVKQGGNALLVLGGIKKEGHMHPNLRNFVVPATDDENSEHYKHLIFGKKIEMITTNQSPEQPKLLSSPPQLQKEEVEEKDVEILAPIMNNSSLLTKNKSIQLLIDKENCPFVLNKKGKKKDKLKFSVDTSLSLHNKSPKARTKKHDESIKNKKMEIQQIDEKIYMIREQSRAKKKSLAVSKNINEVNYEQIIITLKQRHIQDLPMSKEALQKKKIKPNTSRKNSVGKIVSQNCTNKHEDMKDKENTHCMNSSKPKNKEKLYKDIIKEKLLDDKLQDKTQHSLNILFPKSRTDRDKKKEENRPLKLQNNANKLREKYIF